MSLLPQKRLAFASGFILCFLFIIYRLYGFEPEQRSLTDNSGSSTLVKPDGITISGLVFYGRRSRVQSLNCYLQRNLVENGGWLDEVIWAVATQNEDDLLYLDELISTSPSYKRLDLPDGAAYGYKNIWKLLDGDKLYMKIDDDVVWFADDAIPKVVERKLKQPEALLVSANVINSPLQTFLHYHFGALHPYLPEYEQRLPTVPSTRPSWRPSQNPLWEGPEDFVSSLDNITGVEERRWLRLKDDTALNQTPVAVIKYEEWGETYASWKIATQVHYSFLENLENDQLHLYKFNHTWDLHGGRQRINFIALSGDDIVRHLSGDWPDGLVDEDMLLFHLPPLLGRSILVEGSALAAHFSFQHQKEISSGDLLDRYHSYAEENVCVPKVPDPA